MNFIEKLTGWYFTKQALPYWCILILDCLMVMTSYFIGYITEVGMYTTMYYNQPIALGILCCMPCFCIGFHIFRTYQGFLRYSTYIDLVRIAGGTFIGSFLTSIIGMLLRSHFSARVIVLPDFKSALILFGTSTFLIWFSRIVVKTVFESINSDQALPAAIYGTKAGGIALANSLQSVSEKSYKLKAFISDGEDMKKAYLMGRKVYINGKGIGKQMQEEGVKVLLVSPRKSEKFRNNLSMIDEITQAGIRIMMLPAAEVWDGQSKLTHQNLHEVEIEDLLPRDEINIDMDAIGSMLTGKRILITGAAGSIGSEMVRQVAPYHPAEMILVDQAETPMHDIRLMMARQFSDVKNETVVTSITDQDHMEMLFSQHRPEYVFHAAAYKHVPMMEDNPIQAVRNNINGTRIIADLAVKYGTRKFVMISTDKAVNPTNVMGCSKRICEIYCQSLNQKIEEVKKVENVEKVKESDPLYPSLHSLLQADGSLPCTQFVTTRFGNVLGSNGSVIPIFKEQIKKGGPITVTHKDIIRYFMLIPEACKLVLEAGTMGKGGEIFVFDMGKPVKIVDLAKRMIQLSGAKNIEIKFTGLRDGEKLYEEVLNKAEGTIPTHHPKIMIAKVREYDYETARRNEDELQQIASTHDDMLIVKKMKEIVPEFKSKQSKYEILDKD